MKTTTACRRLEELIIFDHPKEPRMINSLHKFLTISFLAVSIFISGLNVDFVGAQDTAVGPTASQRPCGYSTELVPQIWPAHL